jgi:hypothetical protein
MSVFLAPPPAEWSRLAQHQDTELSPKDAVFLPQILDCVLLLLIHPSGNGKEQKAIALIV